MVSPFFPTHGGQNVQHHIPLGSGLDGLDEYGVVGGKIDAARRKNAQGNKRKMCHQTRRNSNENRIQKKTCYRTAYLLDGIVARLLFQQK